MRPLIVTYHSVGDGPRPLCIEPDVFAHHVAAFAERGMSALTVSELAAGLHRRELPERPLAITFDDGLADTVDAAAPILGAHGFRATVFCVSGYLGGANDWPSQPASAPRLALASAASLRTLVAQGWEIGAHGVDHAPLDALAEPELAEQLRRSRETLEATFEVEVTSFAYPYGRVPASAGASLRAEGYVAACTTRPARVAWDDDLLHLPRLDAHYIRDQKLLDLALGRAGDAYLSVRRAGARARRLVM